jgi:MoxR-like ATPase
VTFEQLQSVDGATSALAGEGYLADRPLALAVHLAVVLEQPLLLEGEAGVGKTEVARALAAASDARLIRLQCHEGIDLHHAVYDWDYPRQLLALRAAEGGFDEGELFSRRFLLRRPLLDALEPPDDPGAAQSGAAGRREPDDSRAAQPSEAGARARGEREGNPSGPVVLLIDEIDRADDDFEAFLLELLAEAAVTIPELGTIRATHPPIIVLTSNRTRDLHDAVKRRCLYQWIDYPSVQREVEIVRRRVPSASQALTVQVADAISRMRDSDVQKPPGVAEAIDWVAALTVLGISELDVAAIDRTLGSVLKYSEDQEVVRAAGLEQLVGRG